MSGFRVLVVGLFVVIISILTGIVQDVRDAQAIPAFARKYDFACNVCHVPGFPKLNDFGNVFRDQGYQLGTDGDLPTFEALGKGFWPVSLRTTVGYQVANLRVDGQALATSGFGFTGLDVLSFGTLARNLSFGIVFTPGLGDAGFGTGNSLGDSNLESAFVRLMNLERFVGGASNTYWANLRVGKFEPDLPFSEKRAPTLNTVYVMYHYTPGTPYAATIGFPTGFPAPGLSSFGNANPFALGDNQPGIELTGIKRTDLTGGYFRYSLAGLTTNGGSFGDTGGRSAYFYGHVTQSFGGYGIVAGQRIGAFVLAGNAPTLCPASIGGGTVTGGCNDPTVNPAAASGTATQGEPFRRVGVDFSLTYGGQWNLFGAWMFANDSSNLITSAVGAPVQNAHWNGGFVELNYNPIQLPKWLFIYRYDWITNTQQGTTTSDTGVPLSGNFNNVQSHTIMARYYIHQSTRTDLALHAEYNYYRDTAVGFNGGNLYGQTTLVGLDFAF